MSGLSAFNTLECILKTEFNSIKEFIANDGLVVDMRGRARRGDIFSAHFKNYMGWKPVVSQMWVQIPVVFVVFLVLIYFERDHMTQEGPERGKENRKQAPHGRRRAQRQA